MYLAREMTDNSLPKIGKNLAEEITQLSYMHTIKSKNMIAQDDSLRIEIDTIKTR